MSIRVDDKRCDRCGECIGACPVGALRMDGGSLAIDDSCTLCGLCAQACEKNALQISQIKTNPTQAGAWNGILVFAQQSEGVVHPIAYELIGCAKKLAREGEPVGVLLIGTGLTAAANALARYGCDAVNVYDDPLYGDYRADVYTDAFASCIQKMKPSVVLVGGTDLGKSLAPAVATRFRTGLTADCTSLERLATSELVQIRPAYGGNVMAKILTPTRRPQFATIRSGIMEEAQPIASVSPIEFCAEEWKPSRIEVISAKLVPKAEDIADAKILVAIGNGFANKEDIRLAEQLAVLHGGKTAASRAIVEKGWMPPESQIGLSGKTVKPDVIICCGVSGSVQFMTGMKNSKHIIAINSDPHAPIFSIAHLPICADLTELLPKLIEQASKTKQESR